MGLISYLFPNQTATETYIGSIFEELNLNRRCQTGEPITPEQMRDAVKKIMEKLN